VSINCFTFKKSVLKAMRASRPEDYLALEAEVGSDAPAQLCKLVWIRKLFESSGELDNPGTHVKLGKLIIAMVKYDASAKEWLDDGGSPLIATKLKSIPAVIPILGYRSALPRVIDIARQKHLPAEQWRVGVDPAMMASSLVRAFARGSLRVWDFSQGHVPAYLMDAFRHPSVELEMAEFLAKLPAMKYGVRQVFTSQAGFRDMIHACLHFDLPVMVDAMTKSAIFQMERENPKALISSLLDSELFKEKPDLKRLMHFFDDHLRMGLTDQVIDEVLAQALTNHTQSRQSELKAFVLERFTDLRRDGRIGLAAPWMGNLPKEILGLAADLTKIEKVALRTSLLANDAASKRFAVALAGAGGEGIPFLVDLLGLKGLTSLVTKACIESFAEDQKRNRHKISNYTPVINPRLLMLDVKTLKACGGVHAVLDGFYKAYVQVWGDSMRKVNKAKYNNASGASAMDQVKALATWIGQALNVEPCAKRASQWYRRLKLPFAQQALILTLPVDKDLFQRLDADLLSRKFSNDLGL